MKVREKPTHLKIINMATIDLYNVLVHNDEETYTLGIFLQLPSMKDINTSDYRGYDVVIEFYEGVELTKDELLTLSIDEENLTDSLLYNIEDVLSYVRDERGLLPEYVLLSYLPKTNEKSDSLINEVINLLAQKTGKKYFNKYDFINGKSIRIANHTHNPMNGKCDVNVVISDEDQTSDKYHNAVEDLEFNSSDDVDFIVDSILKKANEI